MKALGLIVEYNPFHNGHLHHLQESKKRAGADVVIAVMSGQFTQRGEPAIIDKWRRTQIALDMGVDLVAELPYCYAVQHADIFARGAVSILSHLKADVLIFGSESGQISALEKLESLTAAPTFQEQVKRYLGEGLSLPRAQSRALAASGYQDMASLPNNILGLHYLRAIKELGASLTAETVPRVHSDYHQQSPNHPSIASATAVRGLLADGLAIDSYVPGPTLWQLPVEGAVFGWEAFSAFLRQKILTLGPEGLAAIHEMKEGLEHRFWDCALRAGDFEDFLERVKSKRYTRTRLQRLCAHILTHTTKDFINSLDLQAPATYVRILGMSAEGQRYLGSIKKSMAVPLVTKFSACSDPMLKHEQKVSAAYGSALPPEAWTRLNLDEFGRSPLRRQ